MNLVNLTISTQPDCVTCGATSLHALYHYWNDSIQLEQVIAEVPQLETGGTLAVLLGCHALDRGYQATLHTFNMDIVDPTWFKRKNVILLDKLCEQLEHATNQKMMNATEAYIKFLQKGGTIHFSNLTFDTIRTYLDKKIPLLSGISATYFYQNMRDYTDEQDRAIYDEWLGKPSGHFVIVTGYEDQQLSIADPYTPHPLSRSHYYTVLFSHWLQAHLLGISSYDAELLAVTL